MFAPGVEQGVVASFHRFIAFHETNETMERKLEAAIVSSFHRFIEMGVTGRPLICKRLLVWKLRRRGLGKGASWG
jgi:hypothetical protein